MRISVILPYKNEARYIRQCLVSLARQTENRFELVAIDDGSRDGSREIVNSFQDRFHRFTHIRTGKRGRGLVKALNMGFDASAGELTARADADDLFHPRRLEMQSRLIESGIDIAGSLVRFFPSRRVMRGFKVYENWINSLRTHTAIASEMYVETPIAHPSLMIRRSVLDRIGGYEENEWPEDFDLMLKAYRAGAVFGKVPKHLLFWREHEERMCRTDRRYSLDAFIRCRCSHLARGPLASGRRLALWGAGPNGKKTATCLKREGIDFDVFIDIDPKK